MDGSGAGKSASYSKPNAYQKLGSYVFTDPKGELYDDTAGYLRTKIANRIEIRHTPKIVFHFDNSVAYGNNIEKIISDIHNNEKK